ncbi:hypothetical protein ACFYVL_04680 [Streptomyces sp. NPDC004111]|uniref:hypothetical protein n=1 Tax=Streptomyces sp. NPDC004111 TaxID=3364690 RepID=UPI0036B24017
MNGYRNTDLVRALLLAPQLALRIAGLGLDALVRALVAAVVARLELDDVVARVDVNRVVERVDVEAVVARVDLDRAVERVDLDRAVARVDVDAIVRRVDVDSVIARVDLVDLAVAVLAEIDVQRVARETGTGMTRETVEAVRERGIRADQLVNRVADRLLRRAHGARAEVAPAADPRPAHPA